MGDAIRKTGVFLRDVREILQNSSGERAKCPRCKGSGLLHLHSHWRQGQPSPSNAPCLFCEGVGVMPIVGLRGYIIGRADAMVSTKGIKPHPVVVERLDHGRKVTRFSTRRHCSIPPQVLYSPVSSPAWVVEAEREAALIRITEVVERRDCEGRSPVGLLGLDHAGWRHRHRFYARTSGSFSNPNGDVSPTIPLEGQAADGQVHSDLAEGREPVVDMQERNGYVVSRTRGHRSSRRPRNRVREEAQKETEARARKVQKLQTCATLS